MGALKKAAEPLKIKGFAAFNCQRWDYIMNANDFQKKKGSFLTNQETSKQQGIKEG